MFHSDKSDLILKGFNENITLHPIILGGNAKISRKTVPKNELLSFKLALQNLYQLAINLSIRKEIRFMPLKLSIIGDSLLLGSALPVSRQEVSPSE